VTADEVAKDVVDAALKVHRALGPGLLESAYQACLAHELQRRRHCVECEVSGAFLGVLVVSVYLQLGTYGLPLTGFGNGFFYNLPGSLFEIQLQSHLTAFRAHFFPGFLNDLDEFSSFCFF